MSERVLKKGRGAWVTTVDGEKLLDFTSGIGVVNTGHCHPKVVEAAQAQCGEIVHGQVNIAYHDKMLELTETLLPIVPTGLDTLFYASTGAEAVENAIKVARAATKKQGVVVFKGSYHGRSIGTMSMTTSSRIYRQKFGPFMPGVYVVPFPYELHGVNSDMAMAEMEELFLRQCHEDDVAAVIIEPVLGEGGYVPTPPDFLRRVQTFCKERDILFICDEVQTGFGRTGSLFACDSARNGHVVPDILTMAKGIASGFPLSAIATRKEIADHCEPGMLGGTYAGNAVACAAAVATQKVIQEEGLVENSAAMGKVLMKNLESLKASRPDIIRDVRGLGLMVGVEFTEKVPASAKKDLSNALLENGMLLLGTSIYPVMRFIPPLTVNKEEIDLASEIFARTVNEKL